MKLRKLISADAPLMLEWMHDPDVVGHLGTNFAAKTMEDCLRFIAYAQDSTDNVHMAVASDEDEYMGTVSLKHVDRDAATAEFAVTVRACAMGKGYSQYGMREILRYGLSALGLRAIYWCVSAENKRAVRFYDKCGYARTTQVPPHILDCYTQEQRANFLWYVVTEAP